MTDQLLVMNDGKMEELGDSDEIYANPKTDYSKRLIAAIPKGVWECWILREINNGIINCNLKNSRWMGLKPEVERYRLIRWMNPTVINESKGNK